MVEKLWGLDTWDLEDNANIGLHCNINDAVQEALLFEFKARGKDLPETLRMLEYELMKVDVENEADISLKEALCNLDYVYHDLEASGFTQPTERMKKAAVRFIKEILKDYEVTEYENTCVKEINVKNWIKRHPDWDKYEE
ncbi:MAG: hypothetical protein P1P65_00675 [Treponema sp.]